MTAVPRELSESVQSSVLDALEEGVIVIDPVGRLLQANAAASAILGIDLASMPPDRQWWNAVVARNATDGSKLDVGAEVLLSGREVRGVAVEVEVERRDGTCVSLLMNYLPFHDGEAVGGLVLSFRDTTVLELERKRRIELRRRLSEALEVARLASWEWQPETDEVIVFQAIADGDAEA
ncbi:MAG TPA: PAS domain-containing protein, partial [Solirubrobacteraceae bacterium]